MERFWKGFQRSCLEQVLTGFGKVLEWCLEVLERSCGGLEGFWRDF